ncbi:MAG: PhoH family protein [Lautropia sp.]
MPLPKAPSRMGQLIDIEEAARAKARSRPRASADEAAGARPQESVAMSGVPAQAAGLRDRAAPGMGRATTIAPAGTATLAQDPLERGSMSGSRRGRKAGSDRTAALLMAPAAAVAAPVAATPTTEASSAPALATARSALRDAPAARIEPPAPEVPAAPGVRAVQGPPASGIGATVRKTASRRPARTRHNLFVLDTNVLMHDPMALFRFQEHDIYLPIMTLEELDTHKRGVSEVSRNARQVSRLLDALIEASGLPIQQGVPLSSLGNTDATGRLQLQTEALSADLPAALPIGKADNQILSVVSALSLRHADRQVVLVSKDINMRIKAHALGLAAEDYFNDQVTEDLDLLYTGWAELPADFWDRHGKAMESWQQNGQTFYRVSGPLVPTWRLNQFLSLDGDAPLLAQVSEINGSTAVMHTLRDYSHHKNAVWGITARNREQSFALSLLMNPDIDFVTLLGQAGTGKTLLTLAAGLAQALEHKRYAEIIMTRATVPVGEDIGYLPGTEEEKMQPWMGALEDNLEVLNQGTTGGGEWGRAAANDLIRSRIRVKAMSFMRGRTFVNKFLIVDEAQNLTPKQMKTLITRAGVGTKVVCLGNIAQIDTPYLTEASSGLTYVVERFKGWAHGGHLTLKRGERSRLADHATEVL